MHDSHIHDFNPLEFIDSHPLRQNTQSWQGLLFVMPTKNIGKTNICRRISTIHVLYILQVIYSILSSHIHENYGSRLH